MCGDGLLLAKCFHGGSLRVWGTAVTLLSCWSLDRLGWARSRAIPVAPVSRRADNQGDRDCLAAARARSARGPPHISESTATHRGFRGASAAVGSSSAARERERESIQHSVVSYHVIFLYIAINNYLPISLLLERIGPAERRTKPARLSKKSHRRLMTPALMQHVFATSSQITACQHKAKLRDDLPASPVPSYHIQNAVATHVDLTVLWDVLGRISLRDSSLVREGRYCASP